MSSSFEKGKFFEDYFSNNLPNSFEILKSPPPYSESFNPENLRPDFLIRHIKTNTQCWIECKYQKIHKHLRDNEIAFFDLNESQFLRLSKHNNCMYFIGCFSKEQTIDEMYLMNVKYMDLMLLNFEVEENKFISMNDFEKHFLSQYF